MNLKYVLSELEKLKEELVVEYSNSSIKFDEYFSELRKVILGEKVRCVFLWANGRIEVRHLPPSDINHYYELVPTTISTIAAFCSGEELQMNKVAIKSFKLLVIDEVIFYKEVLE